MGEGKKRNSKPNKELTSKPFKGALEGVKAKPNGPTCLACQGPIDSRPGWSLPYTRGSRKLQRHGYLHADCEEKAALEVAERQGKVAVRKDGTRYPGYGVSMELQPYDEEEITEILRAKGVEA